MPSTHNFGKAPSGIFGLYTQLVDERTAGSVLTTVPTQDWTTLPLTQKYFDNDSNVVLNGNDTFTLNEGDWRYDIQSPSYLATYTRIRLYNVSTSTVVNIGSTMFSYGTTHVDLRNWGYDNASVSGLVNVPSTQIFRVEMWAHTGGSTNTNNNSSGQVEKYTTAELWKYE